MKQQSEVLREIPQTISQRQVDNIKFYIHRSGADLKFARLEDGRYGAFAVKDGKERLLITTTFEEFKHLYVETTKVLH